MSGLHLAPDLTLTTISDRGRFAEMRLALDQAGRPLGLSLLRRGSLRDGAGRALPPGHTADAEALARLPDGSWLVGFERWHRIRRYRDLDGPGLHVPTPPGLEASPRNAALESLAVLADGRWLALSEGLAPPGAPGDRQGWIGGPQGWQRLSYRPAPGLEPVDAAPLPDGGALVLERGFSLFGGFSGRLVRLRPQAWAAPVLIGEELLRFAAPLPIDNYEGVAVLPWQGRLLVAVISDDNESLLQATILLVFTLEP
ncbi:esterase-like activity of phytase family protein [Roseomonas sp. F4]